MLFNVCKTFLSDLGLRPAAPLHNFEQPARNENIIKIEANVERAGFREGYVPQFHVELKHLQLVGESKLTVHSSQLSFGHVRCFVDVDNLNPCPMLSGGAICERQVYVHPVVHRGKLGRKNVVESPEDVDFVCPLFSDNLVRDQHRKAFTGTCSCHFDAPFGVLVKTHLTRQ